MMARDAICARTGLPLLPDQARADEVIESNKAGNCCGA